MATGTALTNYAENNLINYMCTAAALSGANARPTAWWVSLHTADPTEVGNVAEVPVASAYQRTAVVFGAASAGATNNTGAVTFPTATGSWGTVSHAAIWDAQTGGNCWLYGPLGTPVAITSGITYSFPISQLAPAFD